MEEYLNKGIKAIIDEFPKVGDILNDYEIGCAPCDVGSCLLKDIVDIHNLTPEDESELMFLIAKAIYPDKDIKKPEVKKKKVAAPKQYSYSPPIKKLVDEHKLIKRLLALIPAIIENLDFSSEEGKNLIRDCVDFIRSYADKYHHAKEETILFKYFDEDLDIIQVMLKDHETGRAHVKSIIEALNNNDNEKVIFHLNGYMELLSEHIKKEDEILYVWMERILTMNQIGTLWSKFNEVDDEFGDSPNKYFELINSLESRFYVENK